MNQRARAIGLWCCLGVAAGCEGLPARLDPHGARAVVSTGLAVTYFRDAALSQAAFARVDPAIDFNWADGAPGPGLDAGAFSARWTGELAPRSSEVHRLLLTVTGRVRLWVDGALAVDGWGDASPRTELALVPLLAGRSVPLRLEYANEAGPAQLSLAWEAAGVPREVIGGPALYPARLGGGLRTEYFQTAGRSALRARGVQRSLDVDFGAEVAAPQLLPGPWLLRLSGALSPLASGPTRFFLEADGAAALTVGGVEVAAVAGAGTAEGELELDAAVAPSLELTLARASAGGKLKVEWQPPGEERGPIPPGALLPVGFGRAPAWKLAALVVRRTDVQFNDPSSQQAVAVQSEVTAAEERGVRDVLATLAPTIRALSGGDGVVSLDVITVDDLAVTRVSRINDGFWVSPDDAREILERHAPRGRYDSIFLVWDPDGASSSVPVCCWYGQGRSRSSSDATWASIPILSNGEWTGPFPAEVLVHEWLHGAAAWYRVEGGFDAPDPHLNGTYGYPAADARRSWWEWYRGVLSGELVDPKTGDFAGFTPSVWQAGTPTQPGSIARLEAPSSLTATRTAPDRVELSWAASAGAAHYRVFRGAAPGAETYLSWTPGTAFVDAAVPAGSTPYYVVRAVSSAGGESNDSNEAGPAN